MIQKLSIITILALTIAGTLPAQEAAVIYVSAPKFATPLIEKWISEYSSANPSARIAVSAGREAGNTIVLTASTDEGDVSDAVGRYAVLPVAHRDNTSLDALRKKRLNAGRIAEIFFEQDILADDRKADGAYNVTVYTASGASPLPAAVAGHFGHEASELRGKKIAGDDIYLINAISRDKTGVCFNSLSYIYDTTSRRIKEDISVLPLDISKEHSRVISTGGLDEVIALLETTTIDLIPIRPLTFTIPANAPSAARHFIQWILTEGQSFNHHYGFLSASSPAPAPS
ncbi:MAG: hypothetical protein LBI58_00490, partial [Tannerellaceae bacterium]|nr:hypothetical protein [Tannerellaceae bacterium]